MVFRTNTRIEWVTHWQQSNGDITKRDIAILKTGILQTAIRDRLSVVGIRQTNRSLIVKFKREPNFLWAM